MEIYNEKVNDLLNPKNNKPGGLKVRNHPNTGPYVSFGYRLSSLSSLTKIYLIVIMWKTWLDLQLRTLLRWIC